MTRGEPFKRCGCRDDGGRSWASVPEAAPQGRIMEPAARHLGGQHLGAGAAAVFGSRCVRRGSPTSRRALAFLDAVQDRARRGVAIVTPTGRGVPARVDRVEVGHRAEHGPVVRGQSANTWCPHLGHLRLDEIRVAHVAEMLAEVPGSDATRQRVRATLRAALNDAMRQGLILVNPAALVKLPAGKRPKALVWTAERVERWRAANERLQASDCDEMRGAAGGGGAAAVAR